MTSGLEDSAKYPPIPVGSRTPEQRLRDALGRRMVDQITPGSLYPDQRDLLADIARRRRAGKLEPWELREVEEFERAGIYPPDDNHKRD
ncbi:MAG: hypothetical protein ACREQX_01270 [Candidatus Binataceae bacterium]